MSRAKPGAAFYEGSSWFHRTRELQEDGTVKYSKRGGFQTEEEAIKSHKKYETEFEQACRNRQISNKPNMEVGLKDYLVYWFEEIFSERVENSTRMIGAYVLYDLIIPQIKHDIKLKYVGSDYLDALLKCASGTCKSAGNKSRELLNLALKEAVIQGYIRNNPVTGTKTYPRNKREINILNKEELKVLLKAASKGKWYLEILLAVFCGLRKGEIQGLKFSDFDMENHTVSIKRQVTSNPIIPKGQSKIETCTVVEKPPKTENSYRTLRVPDVIMAEVGKRKVTIERIKEQAGSSYIDMDYISCQESGVPHSVTAMNNALTKLCNRNALPHISVHGLRHMYATILMEQRVSLVKISALLGHASVNTTFEYYCDVMDENEQIIFFMNTHFITEGGEK